jgi:hypothetical protein
MSVFTADVKELQRGFYHTVKAELVYVAGGLGIVKSDHLRVSSTSLFAGPVVAPSILRCADMHSARGM